MLVKLSDELSLSRIVAGVMNWGVWGANHPANSVQKLINQCVEIGVTSFDHADIYGDYTTEKLFGDALKDSLIDRSKIQIVTKCGIKLPCENRSNYSIKSYSSSTSHIFESVNNSLRNLQIEYIDLLLIHRPSPIMDPRIVADAFLKLKNQGKVRQFGVSNFTPGKFNMLNKFIPLVTNQIEASILHLNPFENGSLDNAISKGIMPMAWAPLGGGALFRKSKEYDFVMRRSRLFEVAKKYQWSLDEMAYRFLIHHPSTILPVIGSSKIERIKVAVDCLKSKMNDEQWFEIWSASTGKEVP